MYAVIETGGKQYRVQPGDLVDIERTDAAAEKVEFDQVLLVGDEEGVRVGSPVVEGARVVGVVVDGELRGPKLLVFKKKRRKGYKRLRGHRQDLHRVRIEAIEG